MKVKRHILIPSMLAIYAAVMAVIGFNGMTAGDISPMRFTLTLLAEAAIIAMLFFALRRRDRLREQRDDDTSTDNQNNNK